MYTMSPDEHFRIGTVPGASQVRYVAGLSGHGFKFTSMLGELLASDRFSDPLQL
jgi:glycine/D-amino acid oxidase-like deaminating enzyme